MRKQLIGGLAASTILGLLSAAPVAQTAGWLPCPRCQTPQQAEAAQKSKDQPLNPHDLSGIWGRGGMGLSSEVPPMTPSGQAKYVAAKPGMGPRAVPLGSDPMMICDPLGYPRWLNYNYGMEFVHLPGRTLQFFETYHTYRTIWTDGRVLPGADAEARWMGYSVGRWDGDTFVVESAGFDDRSWLDTQGHQHSDVMRVTERYRRASYDTLEVTLTIDDPKTYTRPWVTKANVKLSPGTEMGEYFCVPSDEAAYLKTVRERAGGVPPR